MKVRAFAAALVALAVIVPAKARNSSDWRRIASDADRARLRAWRDAWIAALPLLPPTTVTRDTNLFDPDRAQAQAMPPAGDYQCRYHRMPGSAGQSLVTTHWQPCTVRVDRTYVRFAMQGGTQRLAGPLYPDTDARAVFLGAVAIGDEPRALPYGRDRLRDRAGLLERIDRARWRLVLPQTSFGGQMLLMELVPA